MGLATIAIPLVTVIACTGNDTKNTKDTTTALTMNQVKAKIVNEESTKWKSTINLPTGSDKILIAKDIGYTPPVLNGVVIEKLELVLPPKPTK